MGRMQFWALKDDPALDDLINSDINELKIAAMRLFDHATKHGGLGAGTAFLKWFASFSAIYLLILDRTNWRTKRRGRKMDCLRRRCPSAFLFPTLPRLAGDSKVNDPAGRGCSETICAHMERQLDRSFYNPGNRMLSSPRAHSFLRRIQKLAHAQPSFE